MDSVQILQELTALKKSLISAEALVAEIVRLEKDPVKNLSQLRSCQTKLDGAIERLGDCPHHRGVLQAWAEQLKGDLTAAEERLKSQFGLELEQELKQIGLPLSGQFPRLKAGLFTIEVDLNQRKVTVWLGPKQERLDQCPLSASEVAHRIGKIRQELGSRLAENEFVEKLQKACARVAGSQKDEPVPVIPVLGELAYLLQNAKFQEDPRRENYTGYSRADFSYDLFRAHCAGERNLLSKRIRRKVAVRAYTARRRGFLWVPNDESGDGTTYSHVQVEEVSP